MSRPRRFRSSRRSIIVALAIVATACSSVVRVQDGAISTGPGAGGTTATSDASGGGGDNAGATDNLAGGSTASTLRTNGSGGATSAATGAATGSVTAQGPCKGEVPVGISYSPDVGAAYAANGDPKHAQDAAASGDAVKQQLQLAVTDINKSGGLGGCQIKPVYFAFNTIGNWTTQTQEECTAFTQDNHVIAIVPTSEEMASLWDCAAAKKTLVPMNAGFIATKGASRATYSRFANTLVNSNDVPLDDWGFMPKALLDAGYFDPGAKLGIIYENIPDQSFVVNKVLKPAFAAIGHPVVDTAAIPELQGFQSFGDAQSQCQSFMLRFRTEGITHVMWTHASGPFACQTNAESQGYRPRNAYTTGSQATPPLEPKAQQDRALMISWNNDTTVSGAAIPTTPTGNPSRDRCNKIYKGLSTNISLTSIYRYCDSMFLLQAAYRKATNMSPSGFMAGLESLGNGLIASDGLGQPAKFGPGRHWGAAFYAIGRWNPDTEKFDNITKPAPIPGA